MNTLTFNRDEVIFEQGSYAGTMFDIVSGKVGIYTDYGTENAKFVAELGNDQLVGEMGLLECYPRSATAVKKAPFRNYEGAGWYVAFYIDAGTPVTILAPGKDPYWVKVQVNGRTGYMESKYLK